MLPSAKSVEAMYHRRAKESRWTITSRLASSFDLGYREGPPRLAALYDKGKSQQWDNETRIDWSLGFDPENPLECDDRFLPAYGSPTWQRADEKRRREIRTHYQAYTLSQILHGEQAALMAAGRLVEVMPDIVSKQFAAQQAGDEARHVEIFGRLISEKIGLAYEIDDALQTLIRQGMSDGRWDFAVLATQILVEGMALGVLHHLREFSRNALVASAAAYVMVDEARHVSFGMHQLESLYSELTAAEMRERSQFALEGMAALTARLNARALWLGLDFEESEIAEYVAPRLPRLIGKILVRTVALLEKLQLRAGASPDSAGKRLEFWHRGDVTAAES